MPPRTLFFLLLEPRAQGDGLFAETGGHEPVVDNSQGPWSQGVAGCRVLDLRGFIRISGCLKGLKSWEIGFGGLGFSSGLGGSIVRVGSCRVALELEFY